MLLPLRLAVALAALAGRVNECRSHIACAMTYEIAVLYVKMRVCGAGPGVACAADPRAVFGLRLRLRGFHSAGPGVPEGATSLRGSQLSATSGLTTAPGRDLRCRPGTVRRVIRGNLRCGAHKAQSLRQVRAPNAAYLSKSRRSDSAPHILEPSRMPAGASDTPNARALLNPTRHARRELASKPHAGF